MADTDKPRRLYHNKAPAKQVSPNTSRDTAKTEFGNRLQHLMLAKGMTQSSLARRAAPFTLEGKFARDLISKYIAGRILPRPDHLKALGLALECSPDALLPARGKTSAGLRVSSPLAMQDLGDGTVWLRLDQVVSFTTFAKIIDLLRAEAGDTHRGTPTQMPVGPLTGGGS